ncbi:MAG: ribonuclease HII [Candidatus Omnitrophica bacterium]|nr:ribonuclease HII [Candidatus Omnitrophota bacterium]
MLRVEDLFRFDESFAEEFPPSVIAGVDEAGRGPLAGPVVAASVLFRRSARPSELNDSKKLSPKKREILFREIALHCLVGIGIVPEAVIDEINIFQATRLAMREAVLALPKTPTLILIDGKIKLDLPLPQVGIVRGDGQSAAIAAASIVAKVCRDHLMRKFDSIYPDYGFAQHKGYPTKLHIDILRSKGISPIHRRSFRPVAELLEKSEP